MTTATLIKTKNVFQIVDEQKNQVFMTHETAYDWNELDNKVEDAYYRLLIKKNSKPQLQEVVQELTYKGFEILTSVSDADKQSSIMVSIY